MGVFQRQLMSVNALMSVWPKYQLTDVGTYLPPVGLKSEGRTIKIKVLTGMGPEMDLQMVLIGKGSGAELTGPWSGHLVKLLGSFLLTM